MHRPARRRPRRPVIQSIQIWEFQPGQVLTCIVDAKEADGYSVILKQSQIQGFVPTEREIQKGTELELTFVCMVKNKAVLVDREHDEKG